MAARRCSLGWARPLHFLVTTCTTSC